ncbi:cytochrome P450 81E8-like protein [Tanacetum coccineum]
MIQKGSKVILVAGIETPYLTLEWAMSLLLNHPNAMKKIKNEIDTHVGTQRMLQEDDLEKLSYLQNVINHYNIYHYPRGHNSLIPGDMSLGIIFPGDMSPRKTCWGKLQGDSFPNTFPRRH